MMHSNQLIEQLKQLEGDGKDVGSLRQVAKALGYPPLVGLRKNQNY